MKPQRRNLIGAGIVPFQVTDDNNVVFFLAREKHVRQWRGSLKWSGFEGGARAGETPIETADREFYEETLGAQRSSSLCSDLRRRDYALEIITSHPNQQQYVTYVKRFDDFFDSVRRFGRSRRWVETAVALHKQIAQCKAEAVPQQTAPSTIHDDDVDEAALRLRDMRMRRHAVVMQLQEACPQSVELTYAKDGLVDTVVIDDCYVEKDAVQPWTLTDIARVLRSGVAEKVFRHSFIPILHVLQREFQ